MRSSVSMRPAAGAGRAAPGLTPALAALAPHLSGGEKELRERRAALAAFEAQGLPGRRNEEWKYSDLTAQLPTIPPQRAAPGALTARALDAALGPLAGLDLPRLVLVDGWPVPQLSTRGFGADRPAEAAPRHDRGSLPSLIRALATGGAAIGDAQGALMLVNASTGDAPSSAITRHALAVGEGGSLLLIEVVLQLGSDSRFVASELTLDLAERASVEHVRVLGPGLAGPLVVRSEACLAGGADYRVRQLARAHAFCRNEIGVTFMGEGGRFDFSGVALARGREHVDTTLRVDHAAPGCTSRELFKGVLGGEARAVFQGKVIVRPGAQKSDGKQMARALMLSETAEFLSKPELEIHADDVACGHGSTSTELDPDHLFYLRSRGIPGPEARALLIEAFMGEVLDEVGHEGARLALRSIADDWLAEEGA